MLKKPAPKKQAAPKAPFFGSNAQGPFAPQQTPPPGYGQAGAMQPQAQGYAPQQPGGFVPPQPSGFGPSQPANFTPSQPVGYSPSQMMYSTPAASYAPQPGYNPGQPAFAPQQNRQAAMPAQPVFYPPQQTYPVPPMPQEYGARLKARPRDSWLQICVLGVLPILFILTLFIAAPFLKWAFIVLAVLSLGAMWYKRAFVSSARMTLSLIYGALILVCAVSLITGAPPKDRAASTQGGNTNGSNSGLVASGITPSPSPQSVLPGSDANNGGQTLEATPPPNSGEDSEAWIRLEQFFNFWMLGKKNDMLNLVQPSWASQQDNPSIAMFQVLANRSPLDYTFENISGADTDSSRTVTMTSLIDKNNGRDPVKIRFQVLMLKVDGQWYVDPNTLASNDEVKEDEQTATTGTGEEGNGEEGDNSQSEETATPKATATPGPKTKLYYNKEGGKYYHIDKECPSVNEQYLPLTNFNYQDLNKSTFKNLVPCPVCHAPERP
jgi:hypothetical protein